MNRRVAAAVWGVIGVIALGAVLLAAFDWRPAVWITLAGMLGLIVLSALHWLGVISLADRDGDASGS